MKKIVLFIFLFASLTAAFSQTDPQITQYMLYPTSFNPAVVGESDMIQVSGIHRNDWIGMRNATSATIFQLSAPFKLWGKKNGIGLQFKNDQVGLFYYQVIHLQYAYKKQLAGGQLSIGMNMGALNAGFHGDSIIIPENLGGYHQGKSADPALQMNNATGTAFDLGLGAWYSNKKFSAGISYLSLTNPTIEWTDKNTLEMFGTLYLTGAYNFRLANPKFLLSPSALLKTNFTVAQVDVSALLKYDERFWGGLAYRWTESIGILLGMNIVEGLSAGYSYDIPLKTLNGWGSHEFFVRYEFALAGRNKNKHKSVRLL
ncbi:MAG: PorP/SprF family type IX secretion system membrane protein [Paludibacter sp.]|jgi:type IX secretion system PorP/SprF family membrane protein|nr:PorP/SprF family type IX secretion system membrane protein [Paludibacter sp.]